MNANNFFYILCLKILDNKIQLNEFKKILGVIKDVSENSIRILDKITEEFEKGIKEENRAYRITKLLSNPKEDLDTREDNLIMKIWFLILYYEEDILKLITPSYCLPFEKELLYGINDLYKHIGKKMIREIINFTKYFLEAKNPGLNYGNSKTFLYKIQAGFFNSSTIENKYKKDYKIQLYHEMKWYDKLYTPFEKFWSKENSINCLNNQYKILNEYVESVDKVEKYKNALNELISKVNNFEFEEKDNNKEKLIKLLQIKLDNPTKEVYEICKEKVENYLQNLKGKLSLSKILFPFEKTEKFNDKDSYVICLDILKNYSKQHKKLNNIFEKQKNNLSDIFQLDKEIEIISDILGKYTLEKG